MQRQFATDFARTKLNEHGLKDWSVRLTCDERNSYLGICLYRDKTIMLNTHHVDIHPEKEVICTILHEIAHALVGPGYGHGPVWESKAREIGCDNTLPCSHLDLPPHVIDAIRSGHSVEVIVEEKKIEQIIRNVTHKVTRLQDKCPECGKVAKEKFAIETTDKEGNKVKLITLECFHIIKKVTPVGTKFETMVSNFWKPEIASCFHKWEKNTCAACGEFRLFDFQVVGARFAEYALSVGKGVLIADDMGLGKTVQALAILRFHGKKYNRCMVVTKSAVTFQWFKQAVRWLGPDYISQIITTSRDALLPGLRLYIISYDLLRRMKREKLHALGINLVILDEVQQIKNPDSTRTQEVRKLVSANPACKVIELSGTPWKNRGSEFFSALNLLDPIKFYSYQKFLDTWVAWYWDGPKKKMGGIANIPKFKEYIKDLVIRREYNEVMEEYPEINRTKLNIQLDALNQQNYDNATSDFVKWYNDAVISGEEDNLSGQAIIAQMQRMRHIVGLAKIPGTLSFVEQFVEDTDKKIVVFGQHIDVENIMYTLLTDTSEVTNPNWHEFAKELKESKIPVFKYTADLDQTKRSLMQEQFNAAPRAIMIASTLACGEGVDLQTCSDSILHERQWNPQNEDQATPGRFRRIGQTSKHINITCPEADGTVDWDMDAIVERKRRQFHEVHNKGQAPVWNQDEIAKEVAKSIVARWNAKNKGQKVAMSAFAGK